MISNRISTLSCSKKEFDSESHVYNSALREAGYTDEIKFEKLPQQQNTKKDPGIERSFGLILHTAIV